MENIEIVETVPVFFFQEMQCVFAGVCFGTKVVRWWRMGPHRNRDTVPPFWLHTFDTRPTWWTVTRGKHSIFSWIELYLLSFFAIWEIGYRRSDPRTSDPRRSRSSGVDPCRSAAPQRGRMSTSKGSALARPLSLWWSTMECRRTLEMPWHCASWWRSSLGPHLWVAGALRILGHGIWSGQILTLLKVCRGKRSSKMTLWYSVIKIIPGNTSLRKDEKLDDQH